MRIAKKIEVTELNVKDLFSYCHKTGFIFWNISRSNGVKKGDKVGSIKIDSSGMRYIQTIICKKYYLVHRIIWLYVHGYWPDKIDHINRDGTDNRIENLRNVSNSENQRNRGLFKRNKSGISGVHRISGSDRLYVYIGEREYLGSFDDFFEACCARKSAERRCGYHENHGSK